jgi:hypothetical protein
LNRCFWRLHFQTRTANRSGICLFGLHYWDASLASLRGRDRQGRRRHVHLRYDPSDISRVAIFENGEWLGDASAQEFRLADGQYEPVSLWELEMAKALVRKQHHGRLLRPQSWLIHLLETRELISQRQAEKKHIRRKVEDLKRKRRGRPPLIREEVTAGELKQTDEILSRPVPTMTDSRDCLLTSLEEEL